MQIIDGKAVSKAVKEQVRQECEQLKKKGVTPGLAVIIVGDDPASQVYVRNKERACEECGFYSVKYALDENTTPAVYYENVYYLFKARLDNEYILEQLRLMKADRKKLASIVLGLQKVLDSDLLERIQKYEELK